MDLVVATGRPGVQDRWVFVSGGSFVVALPSGVAPAVIDAVAALAGSSPSIEQIVAAVPLGADAGADALAIVVAHPPEDADGVPVTAIVRGPIAVDVYSVGGSRRFTDRGIRPWLLADFQAVRAVVVHGSDAPVASIDEVGLGDPVAVRATGARLDWAESAAVAQALARAYPLPAAHRASLPDEDTVIRPRTADAPTVMMRRRDAPPPSAVEETPAPSEDEVEAEAEPVEPPSGAHAASGAPDYGFRVGRGPLHSLDAAHIIGRNPRLPRVPEPGVRFELLAVPSPTHEISSSHVLLRRLGDAIVVTDLRSTNGTVVVPPRAGRIRLRGGESITVLPGTVVHIGDGTIITISAVGSATDPNPHSTRESTT